MSNAGPNGPGHADWRQGCAPSERRSVSDRQSCPEPLGVPPAEATAREHETMIDQIDQLIGSRSPNPAPTAGIDWASTEHAVAVVDPGGIQLERFTVAHTAPGLRQLVARLRRAGVCEVAIERPDGPVVDALLEAGLGVVVIAPNQLKNLRGRYGSAGQQGRRVRRLRAGRCAAHRPPTAATADPRQRGHHDAADDGASPPRPRPCPGGDGQPAPRPPANHAARCDRAVQRHRLSDHAAVPDPVPQPGQGRLAVPDPAGELAALGRLQPPGQPRPAVGTPGPSHRAAPPAPKPPPEPRSLWPWSPR